MVASTFTLDSYLPATKQEIIDLQNSLNTLNNNLPILFKQYYGYETTEINNLGKKLSLLNAKSTTLQNDINQISLDLDNMPLMINNGFKELAKQMSEDTKQILNALSGVYSHILSLIRGSTADLISGINNNNLDINEQKAMVIKYYKNLKAFLKASSTNITNTILNTLKKYHQNPIIEYYKKNILPAIDYIDKEIFGDK